jgi:hypothetical protein
MSHTLYSTKLINCMNKILEERKFHKRTLS